MYTIHDEEALRHATRRKLEGFLLEVFEEDQAGIPVPLKETEDENLSERRSHGQHGNGEITHGDYDLRDSNSSLIASYSEKQNTVESETFGAVMVMMRIARNSTVALPRQYNVIDEQVSGETSVYESQA